MSKKPVPSKKQSVSSSRSRHGAYVRKVRTKLSGRTVLESCKKCGEKKRRHFVCPACGDYQGKQVLEPKQKGKDPIKEIKA